MAISGITSSTNDAISRMQEEYGLKTTTTTNNDMDKDAFLNLLTTQLKYQDPLEPQANEDMLAQMAQFSALEQMQNINTSTRLQQAYDLMGKTVLGAVDTDVVGSTDYAEGVVTGVTLKNGDPYLRVDGKDVSLSNVEAVINTSSVAQEAYNLVGKYVKGTVLDGDTGVYDAVEGFVTSVEVTDGKPYLQVNGREMDLTNVNSVHDNTTTSQTALEDAIKTINETLVKMNEKLDQLSGND